MIFQNGRFFFCYTKQYCKENPPLELEGANFSENVKKEPPLQNLTDLRTNRHFLTKFGQNLPKFT